MSIVKTILIVISNNKNILGIKYFLIFFLLLVSCKKNTYKLIKINSGTFDLIKTRQIATNFFSDKKYIEVYDYKIIDTNNTIKSLKGVCFGFTYYIKSANKNIKVKIIEDFPVDNILIKQTNYFLRKCNYTNMEGFVFTEDNQIIQGNWNYKLFINNELEINQDFIISK